MLLNNEQIKKEVHISNEKFTVTDKRLLFNNGQINSFIGLNELRGVNVEEIDVKVSKLNLPENKVLMVYCVMIVFASIFIYNTILTGDYLPSVFFAFFMTVPATIVLMIVLKVLEAATSKIEKRTLLQIKKTDEGLFLNQFYLKQYDDELNQIATAANSEIYN